jgi:hypothetical protein
MDLTAFLRNYADQIGGQYTEYNNDQSIIIVPLAGNRYQTIIGTIRKNEFYNRKLVALSSKVCEAKPDLDYKTLLEEATFFNYSKFVVNDGYLLVEAVQAIDNFIEESVKEMVQEVANLADQYELKLTGVDIH